MGLFAFPYTSVLDVSANSILGNNTASPSTAVALTASQVRSLISVYTTTEVDTLLSGKANTSHTHAASDITSGTIDTARLGSGTANATTYLRGDQTWATVTAGVGGSTGSADNAVLRADGTGGATLQSSAFLIPDNFTASPNNTVNHASIQATGSTTNVSVSIVPKGTGSFSLQVPDGTSTGGNARGANAVDLQLRRGSAEQVASGPDSFCAGVDSRASGSNAVAIGFQATAVGSLSTAFSGGIAAGTYTFAQGRGGASNHGQYSQSGYRFNATGTAHYTRHVFGGVTTTNSPVNLSLDDQSTQRMTIFQDRAQHCTIRIIGVKIGGGSVASYIRQVTIKRVGNTTSIVGTVNTIGTDEAAGTSIAITADDTNDALQISCTGVAGETWRWLAVVDGTEVYHG